MIVGRTVVPDSVVVVDSGQSPVAKPLPISVPFFTGPVPVGPGFPVELTLDEEEEDELELDPLPPHEALAITENCVLYWKTPVPSSMMSMP
jgi:hypothetical protein